MQWPTELPGRSGALVAHLGTSSLNMELILYNLRGEMIYRGRISGESKTFLRVWLSES